MIEIRWHGRGGQGTITAANLLVKAAYKQGYKGVQTIPWIGAERRGAPIKAFTRLSKDEVRYHSQIYEPDIVILMDHTLYYVYKGIVTAGLKNGSLLLVNSPRPLQPENGYKIKTVDATGISIKIGLEVAGQPVINAPMLGAFAKVTGILELKTIVESIKEEWPGKWADKNVEAAEVAYNMIS
ncbi:MAG: 2-oxoacid:acceptor oxidoreductase family protein [Candidatus Helarchaeota archaeon]